MCAHRTPFGPLPPTPLIPGDNLERMHVTRTVTETLQRHLFPRRAPQLGLLFGQARGDTLTVAVAMRATWPSAQPQDPLAIDERVLLGASEALAFLSHGQLQWCGVWSMHADAQLGPLERNLHLVRRAARRGLCDDRRVLLVAGWEDGLFGLRAFLGASSGEVTELPVEDEA